MFKFLIVLALAPTVKLDFTWNEDPDMTWEEHCDFPGNDISTVQASGKGCPLACFKAEGCTHFTWKAGTCSLKGEEITKDKAVASPTYSVCGIIHRASPPPASSGCDEMFDDTVKLLKEYKNDWHKALCYSSWDPECAPAMLGFWAAFAEAKKQAKFPNQHGAEGSCYAFDPDCQATIVDSIMKHINDSTTTGVNAFFDNLCEVEKLSLDQCEGDILGIIIGYEDKRHAAAGRKRGATGDAVTDGASYFAARCSYTGVNFGPLPKDDKDAVDHGKKTFAKRSVSDAIKP